MAVPSEVFDVPGLVYAGLVARWGRYHTPNRVQMWGWLIQYDLGDRYWMLPADVEQYLCPMRDGLVAVAGVEDEDAATPDTNTTRDPTPATDIDVIDDDDTDEDDTTQDDTDTDNSFDMFRSSGEDTDSDTPMSQLKTDVESDTYYGSGVLPEFVADIEE